MKGVLTGFGAGAAMGVIGLATVVALLPPVELIDRPAPAPEVSEPADLFGPVRNTTTSAPQPGPEAPPIPAEAPVETPPVPAQAPVEAPVGAPPEVLAEPPARPAAPSAEQLAATTPASDDPIAPEAVAPPMAPAASDMVERLAPAPPARLIAETVENQEGETPKTADIPAARLAEREEGPTEEAPPAPLPEPVVEAEAPLLPSRPEVADAPLTVSFRAADSLPDAAPADLADPAPDALPVLAAAPVPLPKPEPVDPSITRAPRAPQALPSEDEAPGPATLGPGTAPSDAQPSRPGEPAQEEPASLGAPPAPPAPEGPALSRNAVSVEAPAEMPKMALVLVDREGGRVLDNMMLSVAIPADLPGAAARADAWRAAGHEIVAIPALIGDGAGGPEDLITATVEALPQAATVMPEGEGGFAGGPLVSRQIAEALTASGHGLIARGSALDPSIRAAEQAGVPVVQIYRRVDGSGRDARAIARFLDQAAFEARNRGSVVVLAENTEEVAAALDRWQNSDRARSVALVPVSSILLDSLGQ